MSYLWVEEYAPKHVNDCVLPQQIKETFLHYVNDKEFPNLILAGPAGVGKTSLARALCDDIGTDLLFVNASLDRGIGDVRNTVAGFASTTSLTGEKKVVLLDEADNLTQDSQKALRALIEEFQNHCRFILTCNYPSDIIEAIHSRCNVVDFHLRNPKQQAELCAQFHKRCSTILKEREVSFSPKVLAQYIMAMSPDWRGILNGLQGCSSNGELTTDILQGTPDELVTRIKNKRWTEVRDWVFEHAYIHPRKLEVDIYKALQNHLLDEAKPMTVLIFAEYSDKIEAGADPSITLLALCTRIMMECQFKS